MSSHEAWAEVIGQIELQSGHPALLSESVLEIWKFIYQMYPRVEKMIIPGYPDYRRDVAARIVEICSHVNWDLTRKEDLECIRIAEYCSQKYPDQDSVTIDLSRYDIRDGFHWTEVV